MKAFLAFAMVILCDLPCRAQTADLCGFVGSFITGGPDRFIASRGQQVSDNLWRTNGAPSKASCLIRVGNAGRDHNLSCYLTDSKDNVNTFYEQTRPAIAACLAKYGHWSSDYAHETEDGVETEETIWSVDDGDVRYSVVLGSEWEISKDRYRNHLAIRLRSQ